MEKLYHITPASNLDFVLEEGLKCGEDGFIYFFSELFVIGFIASQRGFSMETERSVFSLISLDSSNVKERIIPDDSIPEHSAKFHYKIQVESISPTHLTYQGDFTECYGIAGEIDENYREMDIDICHQHKYIDRVICLVKNIEEDYYIGAEFDYKQDDFNRFMDDEIDQHPHKTLFQNNVKSDPTS